jgi:hypothetical protein
VAAWLLRKQQAARRRVCMELWRNPRMLEARARQAKQQLVQAALPLPATLEQAPQPRKQTDDWSPVPCLEHATRRRLFYNLFCCIVMLAAAPLNLLTSLLCAQSTTHTFFSSMSPLTLPATRPASY